MRLAENSTGRPQDRHKKQRALPWIGHWNPDSSASTREERGDQGPEDSHDNRENPGWDWIASEEKALIEHKELW